MSTMKAAVSLNLAALSWSASPSPSVGPTMPWSASRPPPSAAPDVHILKGEYPVAKGLTVGHEPVGVIEKLGSAVVGYTEGQRVHCRRDAPTSTPTPRKTARLRKTAATSSPRACAAATASRPPPAGALAT